jgi:hypothetical protein
MAGDLVNTRALRDAMERFNFITGGFHAFQILRAAVKFDLFSRLSEKPGQTEEEVAKALGLELRPARLLLAGCAATGLLDLRKSRYYNADVAETYLTKDSPRCLNEWVEMWHRLMYKGMFWLYESLKENRNVGLKEIPGTEETIYLRMQGHDPELLELFHLGMQAISRVALEGFLRVIDVGDAKHHMDIGGGNGTLLMRFAKENPKLRGTLFDLPALAEIAEKHIASAGLSDRIKTIGGDAFAGDFPADVDLVTCCHFINIWSEEKVKLLFRRVHDKLLPGGQLVTWGPTMTADRTGPLTSGIWRPYYVLAIASDGGMYTTEELQAWMKEAGFARTRSATLNPNYDDPFTADHVATIGIKAR